MGKRKSSPRLATTSTSRCCYYSLSPIGLSVYIKEKIFQSIEVRQHIVTYGKAMVG